MKRIFGLMQKFEKRNNISITVKFSSNESGFVYLSPIDDRLKFFSNLEILEQFLRKTQYKLDENGKCISPIQEV